ncbi:MAG: protein translocase subunit SecF [Acidimicrobiales bacterium mtb01]|nr:protein translocase subunit SecF [Actinomycetota bacterium]TEX45199.1 MAG: protein translocase subunit SecF [Acidimicrobiales bacterium mtb01]
MSDVAVSKSLWGRLYNGQTSFDFYGKRRRGFAFSLALIVISLVSLFTRGVNLGIDFEGGVAWQVPASSTMDVEAARSVLDDNGIETSSAKIQTLTSGTEEFIRVQVGDEPTEVRTAVQNQLAEKAGVSVDDVSVSSVSSSWGRTITEKAVRALVIFLVLVSLYIAWRFEWRMALAAILAMAHDVLMSVGIYSLTGFEVTPATIVAFLTILGFSLYDTIVVFDKVQDNVKRFSGTRVPVADIVNVSANQVLMRSLNTSIAAILPVLSLLVLGSGVFGAIALREFSLALLVGVTTGAYSSVFIATPLYALLKEREPKFAPLRGSHVTGTALQQMVVTGLPSGSRAVKRVEASAGEVLTADVSTSAVLTHPPRPRKKRRR